MKRRIGRAALGATAAALAGFLAGILTAPKSGRETRSDIRAAANRLKTDAEKQLKQIHSQLADVIRVSKAGLRHSVKEGSSELRAAVARAEVAKDKARTILSALHEGDADDQQLKMAVADARSALEHLKKYVKKPVVPPPKKP